MQLMAGCVTTMGKTSMGRVRVRCGSADRAATDRAPPCQMALRAVVEQGIPVVCSCRVGSGRLFLLNHAREAGFISADNLSPEKARILLMFALARTQDKTEIERIFATY